MKESIPSSPNYTPLENRRQKNRVLAAISIAFIGIGLRLVATFGLPPVFWPDSMAYVLWAARLADHQYGLVHEIYRTPAYPTFIAFALRLVGHSFYLPILIVTIQRILGVLGGVVLFRLLEEVFPFPVALMASLLFVLSPTQLFYESSILTEPLFTSLLIVLLSFSALLIKRDQQRGASWESFILLGMIAGLLSLTRPIGQFLLPIILTVMFCYSSRKRKLAFKGALALGAFFITIFPWLYANHAIHGIWRLSKETGINLYHRVIDIDETPLPRRSSDHAVRQMYLDAHKKPGVTYFSVFYGLKGYHVPEAKIDDRMKRFAIEALYAHPERFIPNTIKTWLRFFFSRRVGYESCSAEDGSPYICRKQEQLGTHSFQLATVDFPSLARKVITNYFFAMAIIFYALSFSFVLGMGTLISKKFWRSPAVVLLVVAISYFSLLTAIFNRADDRFVAPVEGVFLAIAALGLFQIPTIHTLLKRV